MTSKQIREKGEFDKSFVTNESDLRLFEEVREYYGMNNKGCFAKIVQLAHRKMMDAKSEIHQEDIKDLLISVQIEQSKILAKLDAMQKEINTEQNTNKEQSKAIQTITVSLNNHFNEIKNQKGQINEIKKKKTFIQKIAG